MRENIVDSSAVLGSELLRDTSQLSDTLLPVLEFLSGSSVFILFSLSISVFKVGLNFFAPVIENALKVNNHLFVRRLGVVNVLRVSLELLVE